MPPANSRFKFKVSQSLSNDTLPKIDVPFPPNLDPRECITIKKDGNIPLKSPNCFILYRLAFYNELRASGFNAKQKIISEMVSLSWQKEPLIVKKTYKELARKVHYELIKMRRHFLGLTDDISSLIECPDSSKNIPCDNEVNTQSIQKTDDQANLSTTFQNNQFDQNQNTNINTTISLKVTESEAINLRFEPSEQDIFVCYSPVFPVGHDHHNPNSPLVDIAPFDFDLNLQIFNTTFCLADEIHDEFTKSEEFSQSLNCYNEINLFTELPENPEESNNSHCFSEILEAHVPYFTSNFF
ncbi:5635_t:CDS:1 [Ambispora gerdemannii]|uniref:5635_t:CDS:1 n=1 Tax=Ambispora gerdemannii TaxID=144530 RepID=A0A9N9FLG4_9GLOM|nr:5635_t:CDS:1 [Ambispora gerdemannii]